MLEYVHTISVEDYNRLRQAVGWSTVDEAQAAVGIPNSMFLVAAMDDGHTVGMTRIVGDGGYSMLIVDVIVLPSHQGKGIGRAMMEKALAYIDSHLKDNQTASVNLMAAKGKEPFYEKFGFITRPNDQWGAGMVQYIRKAANP